jgi:UPF0716 protein FxsA
VALVLLLIFLLVPIAELYVIVQVADSAGVGTTIALLVAVSVLGSWLVKREGLGVVRRMQEALARAELPTNQLVDGVLILFAGALMLTPGFLTDVLGLVLLIPPTRAAVRSVMLRRFRTRIESGLGFAAAGPGGAAGMWSWSTSGDGASPRVDVGQAVIVTDATEGPASGRSELGGRS